jgi:hypothetical protein
MKHKKKKRMPHTIASPSSYHSNPEVRIESVDNGLIVHHNDGHKHIAHSHKEAFDKAKKELKIG